MRIAIIILVLTFISCDNPVRFEVPQPEGKSDEKVVPKKLIGQYSSLTDSSVLTISNGFIIKRKIASYSTLVSQLNSAERATIKHDTTYNDTDGAMHVVITVKGDSVFQRLDQVDTIFSQTRGDILRKFKGHYFVNRQTIKDLWSVTLLTNVNDRIVIGTVSKQEDIKNLRELTGTLSDTTFEFRPTRKELKKFLRENGFGDRETYVRIE